MLCLHYISPILGFHGVQDHCALLAGFTGRMSAKPVVGKHSIWGAMGQSMLEKVDLNAGALQQRQCHIDQGVSQPRDALFANAEHQTQQQYVTINNHARQAWQ